MLNKRHHGDRFSAALRLQTGAFAGRYTFPGRGILNRIVFALFLLYFVPASATVNSFVATESGPRFSAEYDKILGQWFMDNHMEGLDECVKENHEAALNPFDGVVEVQPDGLIANYNVSIKNGFSVCLKNALEGKVAPPPPKGIRFNPLNWRGLEEV